MAHKVGDHNHLSENFEARMIYNWLYGCKHTSKYNYKYPTHVAIQVQLHNLDILLTSSAFDIFLFEKLHSVRISYS